MNTKPASASWSVKCLAQIPARPDLWVSSPISTVTLGSRGQHRRAVRGLGMAIGHSEAEPFMGYFLRSLGGHGLRASSRRNHMTD